MSYALEFTDKALAGLARLEPWLQEETLDEIDRLADSPPERLRRLAGAFIHDLVRDRGNDRFYVFITLFPEPANSRLQISEIGSCLKRTPLA